ncbi:hypothetical protein MMSR116_18850 [Methylobacterium mesophilicum SR1.6/6]|uniref:Uncharacterized protein n=1 Tax=Methylobacterium mesophilicum SR1.6/6 TaxID=908290 RepID=A0A6B9FU83_9HYPH|nr:hypothetical protein MMSR116_18850 [Methylobacterium mesophilicum SR1.6/6]
MRAVAASPGGLCHDADPTAMPALREFRDVGERATRGQTGRHAGRLTPAGREWLATRGIRGNAET